MEDGFGRARTMVSSAFRTKCTPRETGLHGRVADTMGRAAATATGTHIDLSFLAGFTTRGLDYQPIASALQ